MTQLSLHHNLCCISRSLYRSPLHYIVMCIFFLLLLLASCDGDAHRGEVLAPQGGGALIVGLQTEEIDTPISTVHLFIFGEDEKLKYHEYFEDPDLVALHAANLPTGRYTVIAVTNLSADLLPTETRTVRCAETRTALCAETRTETDAQTCLGLPSVTLADFLQWLRDTATLQPDMQAGMTQTDLREGEVTQVVITIKEGTEGVSMPVLHLRFGLPEPSLSPYEPTPASRAARHSHVLRCIIEVSKADTDEVIHRRRAIPTADADGTYTVPLSLTEGNYHLRLWADYVPAATAPADAYYDTARGLKTISLRTDPYTANTDCKDAACAALQDVPLPAGGATAEAILQRPLAKYRLVATDVARYREMAKTEDYPPLGELTLAVRYEGYFPSGFNVATGKPNDATPGTGILYSQPLPPTGDADEELPVAADWVLVNGAESFVSATVRTIHTATGRVISETSGVRIDYRRGCLTTVKGNFLTAGHTGGGIEIDTEWEGTYEVEF